MWLINLAAILLAVFGLIASVKGAKEKDEDAKYYTNMNGPDQVSGARDSVASAGTEHTANDTDGTKLIGSVLGNSQRSRRSSKGKSGRRESFKDKLEKIFVPHRELHKKLQDGYEIRSTKILGRKLSFAVTQDGAVGMVRKLSNSRRQSEGGGSRRSTRRSNSAGGGSRRRSTDGSRRRSTGGSRRRSTGGSKRGSKKDEKSEAEVEGGGNRSERRRSTAGIYGTNGPSLSKSGARLAPGGARAMTQRLSRPGSNRQSAAKGGDGPPSGAGGASKSQGPEEDDGSSYEYETDEEDGDETSRQQSRASKTAKASGVPQVVNREMPGLQPQGSRAMPDSSRASRAKSNHGSGAKSSRASQSRDIQAESGEYSYDETDATEGTSQTGTASKTGSKTASRAASITMRPSKGGASQARSGVKSQARTSRRASRLSPQNATRTRGLDGTATESGAQSGSYSQTQSGSYSQSATEDSQRTPRASAMPLSQRKTDGGASGKKSRGLSVAGGRSRASQMYTATEGTEEGTKEGSYTQSDSQSRTQSGTQSETRDSQKTPRANAAKISRRVTAEGHGGGPSRASVRAPKRADSLNRTRGVSATGGKSRASRTTTAPVGTEGIEEGTEGSYTYSETASDSQSQYSQSQAQTGDSQRTPRASAMQGVRRTTNRAKRSVRGGGSERTSRRTGTTGTTATSGVSGSFTGSQSMMSGTQSQSNASQTSTTHPPMRSSLQPHTHMSPPSHLKTPKGGPHNGNPRAAPPGRDGASRRLSGGPVVRAKSVTIANSKRQGSQAEPNNSMSLMSDYDDYTEESTSPTEWNTAPSHTKP